MLISNLLAVTKNKFTQLYAVINRKTLQCYCTVLVSMSLFFSNCVYAQGAIPTPPASDQINSSSDSLDVWFNVFKAKVAPILLYGCAIIMIYKGVTMIMHGVDKARELDDWSKMKNALAFAAILVTVGIGLLYLGYTIDINMQETST